MHACVHGRLDGANELHGAHGLIIFFCVVVLVACRSHLSPNLSQSQAARALWSSPAEPQHRLRVSDHFMGLQLMGRNNSAEKLAHYVRNLRPGVTEFMVACNILQTRRRCQRPARECARGSTSLRSR